MINLYQNSISFINFITALDVIYINYFIIYEYRI